MPCMTLESPRSSKLAQLVSHHALADEHRYVLAAIVDGDSVTDHLRKDSRRARPCLDDALVVGGVQRLDPGHQSLFYKRTFF